MSRLTIKPAVAAGVLALILMTTAACQEVAPLPSPSRTPSVTSPPKSQPATVIDLAKSTYSPAAGKDGGSVTIGDWREATQFNPYYLGQGSEPAVASAAWATLVTVTDDQRYLPTLAATLPTVDNGAVKLPGEGDDAMTVTWTLRDGLKWSDGEALTCDDFKYAWEWALDTENFGVVTAGFEDVKSVDCKTDTEMVWHLKRVYQGYLTLMRAPLPRHYLEAIPMKDQSQGVGFRVDEVAKLPVSGPFMFVTVTPASSIKMTRNPNYVNPTTAAPAHLAALTFRWYADRAALIAAYRAGDVDVASGLEEDDLPKLTKLDDQIASRPSMMYETLRPNWSADTCSRNTAVKVRGSGCPMADPALRKAVAAAIDRSALADLIPGSTGQAPVTNVNPQAWFYAKQAGQAFSPAAARKILDESGWKDADHDGIREKEGLQARIEVCTTARQTRLDGTALVAAWLKDVGIATTTRVADPVDMFATYDRATAFTPCALERGNFDLAMQSMPSSTDPGSYYLTYHSSQFEPDGQNDAHVDDVGIDVALETVKATANATVIADAMVEFQKVYAEQTVEIPIQFSQTVDLHASAIGNFVGSSPAGGPTWNVADWFIKG